MWRNTHHDGRLFVDGSDAPEISEFVIDLITSWLDRIVASQGQRSDQFASPTTPVPVEIRWSDTILMSIRFRAAQ
jgi:hypothetical protein